MHKNVTPGYSYTFGMILGSTLIWLSEPLEMSGFVQSYSAYLWLGYLIKSTGLEDLVSNSICKDKNLGGGELHKLSQPPPRDLNNGYRLYFILPNIECLSSNLTFRKSLDEERAGIRCQRQKNKAWFCEDILFSSFLILSIFISIMHYTDFFSCLLPASRL